MDDVLPTLRKTGTYSMDGKENVTIIMNFCSGREMSEENSERRVKEKEGELLTRIAKTLANDELSKLQTLLLLTALTRVTPTKNISDKTLSSMIDDEINLKLYE